VRRALRNRHKWKAAARSFTLPLPLPFEHWAPGRAVLKGFWWPSASGKRERTAETRQRSWASY
jgi:hypothetical protein